MQIDYALILSAGLGTRMGEIGKVLPKVLWPVFNKRLLELQIRYCQELGIKKIYINTHYLHDHIEQFLVKENLIQLVTVLHEDPLLDSGGAIHNLARQSEINYTGNVLLVNADQFLFFDKKFWQQSLDQLPFARASLLGIKVDKKSNYNQTIISHDRLVGIEKNVDRNQDYYTYSGLGLLKLDGLKPAPGATRFFETVANYKNEAVSFVCLDDYEYWDFGTASIYAENILKINHQLESESHFQKFLKRNDVYVSESSSFLSESERSISLDYSGNFATSCLVYESIKQKF